jgi:hypothetical protein
MDRSNHSIAHRWDKQHEGQAAGSCLQGDGGVVHAVALPEGEGAGPVRLDWALHARERVGRAGEELGVHQLCGRRGEDTRSGRALRGMGAVES